MHKLKRCKHMQTHCIFELRQITMTLKFTEVLNVKCSKLHNQKPYQAFSRQILIAKCPANLDFIESPSWLDHLQSESCLFCADNADCIAALCALPKHLRSSGLATDALEQTSALQTKPLAELEFHIPSATVFPPENLDNGWRVCASTLTIARVAIRQ